jgi:hypothetical protein
VLVVDDQLPLRGAAPTVMESTESFEIAAAVDIREAAHRQR